MSARDCGRHHGCPRQGRLGYCLGAEGTGSPRVTGWVMAMVGAWDPQKVFPPGLSLVPQPQPSCLQPQRGLSKAQSRACSSLVQKLLWLPGASPPRPPPKPSSPKGPVWSCWTRPFPRLQPPLQGWSPSQYLSPHELRSRPSPWCARDQIGCLGSRGSARLTPTDPRGEGRARGFLPGAR